MTTKIKILIFTFAILLAGIFVLPVMAGEDYGLDTLAGKTDLKVNLDIAGYLGGIVGTALSLISLVFFGLLLYAGIMWMLARGNAEEEKKALNTIIGAIIGLFIVMGSYALTVFVFSSFEKKQTSMTSTPSAQTVETGGAGAGGSATGVVPVVVCKDEAECTTKRNACKEQCIANCVNACNTGGQGTIQETLFCAAKCDAVSDEMVVCQEGCNAKYQLAK